MIKDKKLGIPMLLILMWLVTIPALAKHSDTYLFGSYSYLQHSTAYLKEKSAALAAKMRELGYNITVVDTDNNDKSLPELLKILDDNGVDAMLTDKCWSNDPKDMRSYAMVGLSTSNYQRFEAEFVDGTPVKPEDANSSLYWYGTVIGENNKTQPSRVGRVVKDKNASYDYTWKCTPNRDKEGFAYTDITYRWKNNQGNAVKLSDELRIYNTHVDPAKSTDSLYIRFRIKLADISPKLRSDNALFSFSPTGFLGKSTEFANQAAISLNKDISPQIYLGIGAEPGSKANTIKRLDTKPGQNNLFTYTDYVALGSPTGYFELEYALSYKQLKEANLLSGDLDHNAKSEESWWWYAMRGISPRLYWYGNCELSLDYVEIEDPMYRKLRQHPELYKTKMNQRLRGFVQLPHGDIIKHFYTMDEPFQPNMNSLKLMMNWTDPDLPTPLSTIYDIKYHEMPMPDGVSYYDHVDLARKQLQPKIIMTDIYPIKPGMNYHPREDNFLQDVLDNKLLKTYRDCKTYTLEKEGRMFYPIVQAFGYWDSKSWLSWTLPPSATQRALLSLPLCYQPDGMLNYRMFGFIQANGAGEYTPVNAMPDGTLQNNSYVWDAVKEANPRLKYYGELIKPWSWLGANTAMKKRTIISADLAKTGIKEVRVPKSSKGIYKGYIECGYFLDESGQMAVFAVNRRSDYLDTSAKKSIKNPNHIPPDKYNEYYREFGPQVLQISMKKGNPISFPALFDPYEKKLYQGKKNTIKVEMQAGEGRLLKLVGTLPAKLKKGKYQLGKEAVVQGKVTLNKKAEVICDGDLTLLPGSSIILKKGSKLTVLGKIIKLDSATISEDNSSSRCKP